MDSQLEKPVNLYLIGFMGVGKSAVGRGVAKKLGFQFIDSDSCIQKKYNCKISEIFDTQGEKAFRKMEQDFIEVGHNKEGCVISTGGGLVMEEGMTERLQSKGVVICLFADAQTIYNRTSKTNKRPLLQVEDPLKKIKDLLEIRLPVYQKSGIGICTENRSLSDVVAHVTRSYYSDAQRFIKEQKAQVKSQQKA